VNIVIDANVALALVIPLPYSHQSVDKMIQWQDQNLELAAPTLWSSEVLSGIRKAVTLQILTNQQAQSALEEIWALDIKKIEARLEVQYRSLLWAEQLNQSVSYDAEYIALAEDLGVAFWSADQRLVNNTSQLGIDWIHWIGEE